MKTITPSFTQRRVPHRNAAFTLVEMLTSFGLFTVIFVGVMVGLQIFGMRIYTLAATKLTATADARKTMNALRGEIRSAKIVYVGNYTNGEFFRIPDGQLQTGNALEIYGADTNDSPNTTPVTFYQSSVGNQNGLYSVSNGVIQQVANYLTNNYVFTAEDYQANTLTTYDNNPVIRVTLQFYQWEYPIGGVGIGPDAYNFYRLQTRVSRRAK